MDSRTSDASAGDVQQMILQAARQHQAGRPEAAEPAYRQILELDPGQADAHHLLGLAVSQRGENEQACTHIRRAIELLPESPDYHNSLGVVLAGMERFEEAVNSYREALRVRPDYVEAHYNLAGALHRLDDSETAAAHYGQVLEMRPDDVSAHNNLGCILRDLGRLEEAEAAFNEALRIDPEYVQARQNLEAIRTAAEAAEDRAKTWIPPVIVTAPTERNGVTLVQRLLNSTKDIVVYGEDSLFFRAMPQLFFEKLGQHARLGATGQAVRRRFTEESTEFWSSGLWPDLDLYARTVGECFNRLITMYFDTSRQLGYRRWGMKQPLTEAVELPRIRQLIPTARIVFVYRNLFDVARSAKARRFADGPEQMADLARRWQANLMPVLQEPPEGTLVIRYESLVAEPDKHIAQLEQFVDLKGVDRMVMQRRFNTFAGEAAEGHSPTEYIEPQALTAAETAALRTAAADALELTGYEDAAD